MGSYLVSHRAWIKPEKSDPRELALTQLSSDSLLLSQMHKIRLEPSPSQSPQEMPHAFHITLALISPYIYS